MDLDGPLDFENEDPLVNLSAPIEKREKVIGLDDLLSDFYKEKSKIIDKANKKRDVSNVNDSYDGAHARVALLSKCVEDCQNQVNEIGGLDDNKEWGLCMFEYQKIPSPSLLVDFSSCYLLKEFMHKHLNSVVGLSVEEGTTFLERLLVNGWLTGLVLTCGRVEKVICKWTLNILLYSSKEDLRSSACHFWCSILLTQNEVNGTPVEIFWLPNYEELKEALDSYGFRINLSQGVRLAEADSEFQGPPQNIRAWLKVVTACCRRKNPIFSTSQVEQIAEILVLLLLDRSLLGLSLLLQECLIYVIGSFKEDEWVSSCRKIAISLASSVPQDMNYLRVVESVSGDDARSKNLRSSISNQMLVVLIDHKKDSDENLLNSLMSINVKDKSCNLFKTYILVVLAEQWLFSTNLLEEKPVLGDMWAVFLRNCSCQINSADLRSYASKNDLGSVININRFVLKPPIFFKNGAAIEVERYDHILYLEDETALESTPLKECKMSVFEEVPQSCHMYYVSRISIVILISPVL